ncbi:MAG: hypothetical protein FWF53_05670 [Candidatus Azobacteroides sp.]|nr:hypothetical protein [Candidatus Azobacteroides sp.]
MKTENYTWKTTFETAENTMTHVFNDRVKIILNFALKIIITVRDGEAIDKFECDEMTINEYETFLIGTAKNAALLEHTSHE